jgi:hypothetical protein
VLTRGLRLRAASVGVAVGLGAVAPVVAASPAFCAGDGPRAVLVVDRENGTSALRMCVSLPGGDVSGLELIRLAADQYDLQYRFGHGGAAVCQLANVPAERPPNECLRQGDPFWGYWRSDGGGWQWSGSGAGATRVEDGDVEGWSFGYGNDGSTHPQPPATKASDVCRPVREKGGSSGGGKEPGAGSKPDRNDLVKSGGETRNGGRKGEGGSPSPSDDTATTPVPSGPDEPVSSKEGKQGGRKDDAEEDARARDRGGRSGSRSGSAKEPGGAPNPIDLPTPTPSALPANATSADDGGSGSGFPVMGLVALAAAGAMGTAAAVVATRRRKKGAA